MLEAIRFVNCQSFEDITVEFATDRTNVLVAENNTGKSILFKMLKVTANPNYFPLKKRNMLIRRGAISASMICAFTDGCIGITTITDKGVIYRWKNADEDSFSSFTEPPQKYLDELGLIVDQKTKFIANIVDTDQDMLLVNSDQKGNHELLRLLAEDQTIVDTKEKLAREISYFKKYNSDLTAKQVDLRNNLNLLKLDDVETLRYEYNSGKVLYDVLYSLIEFDEHLTTIQDFCEMSFNYTFCVNLIDSLLALQHIAGLIGQIYVEPVIDDSLLHLIDAVIEISNILDNIQIVESITFEPGILDNLVHIAELFEKIQIVVSDSGVELVEALLCCTRIIAKINSIGHFQREISALDSDIFQTLNEISTSGRSVTCPIHGEVIYDGEECVPYNI